MGLQSVALPIPVGPGGADEPPPVEAWVVPAVDEAVLPLDSVPPDALVATGVVDSLAWVTGVELGGGEEAAGVVCSAVVGSTGVVASAVGALDSWDGVAACSVCRRTGTCLTRCFA